MANINDALKRLFLKLGGNPEDLKDDVSVEDYIDNLGEVLCGAELPPVSGSDNGKVLTVSSGKWEAKQPASPTSYELTGLYIIGSGNPVSISMPSGLDRNTMCNNGKAIKEKIYLKLTLSADDTGSNNTTVYLPCSACCSFGCIFYGIATFHTDTTSYKLVTVFVSENKHNIPDAIKIEDFSFEST